MITIRSTVNCVNTPRVLLALEELGVPYQVEVADDGFFNRTYGSPGPTFEDGGLIVVEIGAVLRHVGRAYGLWPAGLAEQAEIDRWMELQHRRLGTALWPELKADKAARLLALLDARLEGRDWLIGEFSIGDCSWSLYAQPSMRARLPIDGAPRVAAWLDRIAARPAWARAMERVPR